MPNSPKSASTRILSSAHYFHVADLDKAVTFYQQVLGFPSKSIYGQPPFFAILGRDNVNVMLAQVPDPNVVAPAAKRVGSPGAWDAYFWVQDAQAIFAEFRSRGAAIDEEPSVKPHGCLEFQLQDADGYVLVFGQNLDAPRS